MNKHITVTKGVSVKMMLLLTLVFFIRIGHAQQTSALVGSWTVNREASMAGISTEDRAVLDSSPELMAGILQGLTNRQLVFNQDGSFYQVDGMGNQVSGIWNLQGQTLTISNPAGGQWVQQVLQLSTNQLALQQTAKGEALPIVPILYLTKNQ